MLREALDPANQSLRDALRLSFRVLQLVMVVLVVVFLFSGLKTIEPGKLDCVCNSAKLKRLWNPVLAPPFPAGVSSCSTAVASLGISKTLSCLGGPAGDPSPPTPLVNDFIRPGRDGRCCCKGLTWATCVRQLGGL